MDPSAGRTFAFGDFRLEVSRRRLLRGGEPVALTPRVFDTLLYLVEHRGVLLSRDQLLAALWPDVAVEENNLGQAISKLRHILGEAPGDNRFIVTIPGRGYRFVADVTPVVEGEEPDVARAPADTAGTEAWTPPPGSPAGRYVEPRRRSTLAVAALASVAVVGLALAALQVWGTRGTGTGLDRPRTLAVLPFAALAPQDADAALELGMADSLIAKLGHVQELTVSPLSAVRRFHNGGGDPGAAGRELGVDAVLEGHIHRTSDRVRVTVRLIRVGDGRQLWAAQYDEQPSHIFAIQDGISERVARQLAVRLTMEEEQRLTRRYTSDAGAYEAYLKGRVFLSLAQPRNATEMFEEAVRLDPRFALARAGLADTLSRLPIATDGPSRDVMRRARSLAAEALAIDPDLGEAHAVLGWIGFYHDWDWPASEQSYRRALAINGRNFSARLGYAHLLANTYRSEEAIAEVDHALALDPLSPLAGTLKSQFLFYAGRHQAAYDQLQRTLERSPAFWIGETLLGRIYLQQDRFDEAAAAFSRATGAGGVWTPRALMAYGHAVSGRREEARRSLDELLEPGVPPYLVALVHLGLGDRRQALQWLERAHDERDVRMVFLGVDPVWHPLRSEERFAALLKRMRL